MSFDRQMRRKKAKELSYQQRVQRELKKQQRERVQKVDQNMKYRFISVLESDGMVPTWAKAMSCIVFPKKYRDWWFKFNKNMPPEKLYINMLGRNWPTWRINLNIYPYVIVRELLGLIFVRPWFRLSLMFASWGIYTKREIINQGCVQMRIYKWFRLVDKSEWVV